MLFQGVSRRAGARGIWPRRRAPGILSFVERAFAAEFPNDNEELHSGAIWRSEEPCGRLVAHLPPPLPEPPAPPVVEAIEVVCEPVIATASIPVEVAMEALEESDDIEIVDELEIDDPIEVVPAPLESEVVLSSHAARAFVEAMEIPPPARIPADFAIAIETIVAGEEPEKIEEAPAPPAEDPYAAFLRVLVEAATACGGAIRVAAIEASFAADPVAAAWRAILRAESEDFSLCATTLDEWAANALAGLLGAPSKGAQLRRELRARGVAAFGMVLEAA
jgi:hypothetical protein